MDGLITNGHWDTFLTIEREKLLMVRRKHLFVVIFPILLTSLLTLGCLLIASFVFLSFYYSLPMLIISALMIISVALTIATKCVIDWYFHIFIVTDRKMLEICYTPLSSHIMSEVLLDKVNCTEVDLRVNGFFHELIGMGDVIITFDRPTHREEFVITDMSESNKISRFLSGKLIAHEARSMQPIWYRRSSGLIPQSERRR